MALEAADENNDPFPAQLVPQSVSVTPGTADYACALHCRHGAIPDYALHNSYRPTRFAGEVVLRSHSGRKPSGCGIESPVGTLKAGQQRGEICTAAFRAGVKRHDD